MNTFLTWIVKDIADFVGYPNLTMNMNRAVGYPGNSKRYAQIHFACGDLLLIYRELVVVGLFDFFLNIEFNKTLFSLALIILDLTMVI